MNVIGYCHYGKKYNSTSNSLFCNNLFLVINLFNQIFKTISNNDSGIELDPK